MITTPSARSVGSNRHSRGTVWNRRLVCLFFAVTSCAAQIPGSITIRNLPQYAYGASAVDSAGNLYIAATGTSSYPTTPGAAQTQFGGEACNGGGTNARPKVGIGPPVGIGPQPCGDVYLTKVDPNGNTVYATFLGGPWNDYSSAVTIDAAGDLYVTGTAGLAFPTTAKAAIAASTTSTTFVAKLNKSGSAFVYATYLPDTIAKVYSIALDPQGVAYISGTTVSSHAVVVAVSADGSIFPYTTTLSGSQSDFGGALLVDSSGDVVVIGQTDSPDFPITAGVVQPHYGGAYDQFVAKLDPTGKVVFSTYLGGSGGETGGALGTDAAGNIYISGPTTSTDFRTTADSFQSASAVPIWNNSSPGGFLTSLSADGKTLRYSTYVPSPDRIGGPYSIAVGPAGDVYLLDAGLAGSPATPSAPQPCYDGADDVVLMHFGQQGQLEDSTFVGDPHVSLPSNRYLPGDGSILLPSTTGGTGNLPALVQVRFGEPGWTAPNCITPVLLNSATLTQRNMVVAAGEVVSLVGVGTGPAEGVAYQPGPQGQAPKLLGGVQVFFDGIPAPILYAQSNQVNLVVPVEMNGQPSANVTVQYQNTTVGTFVQQLSYFDPAIFRWNPGVSTQAAAINQDGTVNGPAHPAPAGSIVSVWGTGLGALATPCSDGNLNVDAAVNLATGYSMTIDGQASIAIQYIGGAPLLLCGVEQINIQIPPGAPSGNFAIYPWAEYQSASLNVSSQAAIGATIVVR